MKRIVILVSGQGSNMQRIAQACEDERWPARVVAVLSNRPQAQALTTAQTMGLTTGVVDHRDHAARDAFDEALRRAIDLHAPDLVVLAGFMRILGDAFVRHYEGRMLNVHPSLLPAFTGLRTHQRALQAGCKLAGATVHFVTPELDHGPIVIQAAVPVLPGDDEAALAARVLRAEHHIYPRAVRWFVEDKLRLAHGHVQQVDGQPQGLWQD